MSSSPANTKLKPNTRSRSSNRPAINYNENTNRRPSSKNNKRKASNSSPTTTSPEAKKTTASKMSISLADIEKLLEKHTVQIKEEMKNVGNEIKTNLEGQMEKINKRIDSIQDHFDEKLKEVRTDVDKCIEQLDMGDETNTRISLLNELKLNGIAHSNGENLKEIFQSIAHLIGYDTSSPVHIPDLTRTFKRNNNEITPLPLIIMRFVAKHVRNKFYGLYLAKVSKQSIKTEDIKLPQGGFVRIGENLTQHNQKIFMEAMKLKRDKLIAKVFTIDGLVNIKINATEKAVIVKTQRELDMLLAWANEIKNKDQIEGATKSNDNQMNNNNNNEKTNEQNDGNKSQTLHQQSIEQTGTETAQTSGNQMSPPGSHTNQMEIGS